MYYMLYIYIYIYINRIAYGKIPHVAWGERGQRQDFLCRRCLRFFADVVRKGYRTGSFLTESGAKMNQNRAKRVPKRPKWSQKGAKTSPGDLQRNPCGKVSILDAKRASASLRFGSRFSSILVQIHGKTMTKKHIKNGCPKYRVFLRFGLRKWRKMRSKSR